MKDNGYISQVRHPLGRIALRSKYPSPRDSNKNKALLPTMVTHWFLALSWLPFLPWLTSTLHMAASWVHFPNKSLYSNLCLGLYSPGNLKKDTPILAEVQDAVHTSQTREGTPSDICFPRGSDRGVAMVNMHDLILDRSSMVRGGLHTNTAVATLLII